MTKQSGYATKQTGYFWTKQLGLNKYQSDIFYGDSFIPYKDGVTEGDFLIEDYFSWDDTIKAIVEDVIPDRKHPIKMLPNLPDKIKKELEKRINKFEADEFNGFIPLLDKIVELTKEQAV